MYDLVLCTYLIGAGHFASEYWVYGSMGFGRTQVFVASQAVVVIPWMVFCRDNYIGI